MLFKSKIKFILSLICVVAITSCSTPYFGYSENQWHKLDALQQQNINAQYQEIITSRNSLRRQDEINQLQQTNVNQGQGIKEHQEIFIQYNKY